MPFLFFSKGSKMLISSHFPLNVTKRGLQHVDFPFILAQYWHRKPYRDALSAFSNTFAIVDNGAHETGRPLSPDRVAEILDTGGGWKGILPDYLHKPAETWATIIHHVQIRGLDLKHWGIVLHGHNAFHIQLQHDIAIKLGVGVICFPFKSPRANYLSTSHICFDYNQRYHLMGLSEDDDLETYGTLPGTWSIDTMKIWKVDLSQPGWHGHKADPEQSRVDFGLVKANVQYLKERFDARTLG
jgi:hypothetical protein